MSRSFTRSALALVALATTASHAAAQSAPRGTAPARPSKQYTIEQFMNVTGVRGAGFSPGSSQWVLALPFWMPTVVLAITA